MTLTKRRKQFLTAIQKYYEATGEPLHYEDLARLLRVSKWTAYDMVRELAKDGLVIIEYTTKQEERQVGRSRLSIRPSALVPSPAPLSEENERILTEIQDCHPDKVKPFFQNLLETAHNASASNSKERFCFYLVAALALLSTRLLRGGGMANVLQTLLAVSRPEVGLVAAVGLTLGLIIRAGISPETKINLQELVTYFQEYVGEITDEERQNMKVFWQTALEQNLTRG